MDRVPVSSSNISTVGYDANSSTLEIGFHHGGVYQYFGVPQGEYDALLNAASKGIYFNAYIRDRYPTVKL